MLQLYPAHLHSCTHANDGTAVSLTVTAELWLCHDFPRGSLPIPTFPHHLMFTALLLLAF